MEPARLAASKQLAPQGPGRAPEQQGPRNRKETLPRYPGGLPAPFFAFYVLPDWTPTGGKLPNTGIFGSFGLGQPLALREIPGPGRRRKKTQFSGARGTFGGGNLAVSKVAPGKCATCLPFPSWPADPHRREITEYWFWPFRSRTALGT